jgi:beta-glucuronidase
MLRPQSNDFRDFLALDGLWACLADPDKKGISKLWHHGFESDALVAIPGSINEQLAERGFRDYYGDIWLAWTGRLPRRYANHNLQLRFASADLKADVWINGEHLGSNDLPFLPFQYDVSSLAKAGEQFTLVVRLSAELDLAHPLPGVTPQIYLDEKRNKDEIFPPVRYDFFPYLGLHRGVAIIAQPAVGLRSIDVQTDFDASTGIGKVSVKVIADAVSTHRIKVSIVDNKQAVLGEQFAQYSAESKAQITLKTSAIEPWSTQHPKLYRLVTELIDATGQTVDQYEQSIGFRRLEVSGQQILLNGQAITLRGFGMHEDFPILGKTNNAALRVKDFELLRWLNANSFRTSHYAYAEETLDEADRRGFLVISEVASINLDFRRIDHTTLGRHQDLVARQMARDGSHACVIAWSLTNEPGYLAEPEYLQKCGPYWESLFSHAKALDPSRPITAANVGRNGLEDPMYAQCDFISINRYLGWYEMPGQLARAKQAVQNEVDALSKRYGKPMLFTEFGADAVAGMHSTSDQLFTEEYQADFLEAYWDIIDKTPGCIGGHVWNFADFRTAQHHRRVQFNMKGVFTRVRDPKMAAWTLKRLWQQPIT